MDRCNGIYEITSVETMALDTLDGERRLIQNVQLVPRKGTRPLPTVTLHTIEGGELAIGQHFELTLEKIDPLPAGGVVVYHEGEGGEV